MKILVSNDDGYLATGINTLIDALEQVAEVVVVAPDRNRSAASNSLTLATPLRVSQYGENRFRVDGTPSDCVHGKGLGSGDRGPVLKHAVNRWLRQWDCVLAFISTRQVDGGTGAVYVLLQRI